MWKLLSIHAKNLCAFRELHYKLFQGVTTLIFGNNMDNDSQKSNGSGKSALVEAVALGITGAPLRRIKNEEIINDMAEQCMITLHLQNDTSNEELYIERHLSRKGPAVVECSLFRDGVSVNTGEAVHPTVDAYNKYILNKLGITKDELYNNFILSRHKYQDFLSSSDKDKKEIINRFSNAILVDKAIEKLIDSVVDGVVFATDEEFTLDKALEVTLTKHPEISLDDLLNSGRVDDGSDKNRITYTFNEKTGTLIISGEGAMPSFDTANNGIPRPWDNSKIKKLIIREGVTEIGSGAFKGASNLKELYLPESLTHIAREAFANFPESGVKIEYAGTRKQWRAINVGSVVGDYGYDNARFTGQPPAGRRPAAGSLAEYSNNCPDTIT